MAGLERVPVGGVARVVDGGRGVAVHGGRGHLPGRVGVGDVGNGDYFDTVPRTRIGLCTVTGVGYLVNRS